MFIVYLHRSISRKSFCFRMRMLLYYLFINLLYYLFVNYLYYLFSIYLYFCSLLIFIFIIILRHFLLLYSSIFLQFVEGDLLMFTFTPFDFPHTYQPSHIAYLALSFSPPLSENPAVFFSPSIYCLIPHLISYSPSNILFPI